MSKTVLLVVTDGRQKYMEPTMEWAERNLRGEMTGIIVDDSADPSYGIWLGYQYPGFWINSSPGKQGMAKTVAQGWELALQVPDMEYVFHLEEDFIINHPIILDHLIALLEEYPNLAQVVLQRQPWNPEEVGRGSIFDNDEDWVVHAHTWDQEVPKNVQEAVEEGVPNPLAASEGKRTEWWVQHQRIFSLNPCLIPRRIIEMGWPAGNEAQMTDNVKAAGYEMAFWGSKDEQAVTHIGQDRGDGWKL